MRNGSASALDDVPRHKVFLSYSREDEDKVLAIDRALEETGLIDVLRDKEDIFPAEDWKARLEALIVSADAIVFCMSPDSLTSDVVAWELEVAFRLSKRIVPAVLQVGGPKPLPEIARLNYVFLDREAVWEPGLGKLRDAITADFEWVREHTRLGELAHRWETDRRPNHELIRGPALDAGEAWLAAQPHDAPPPSALHRAFIAASRQRAVRQQQTIMAVALGVAVMALGLSALAYWQRGVAIEQRTEATARSLAAEAQVILADPLAAGEEAVRDLLISRALSPSQAADDALDRALRRLPPQQTARIALGGTDLQPGPLTFDTTGRWLAMASKVAVSIWAVDSGTLRLRHDVAAGAGPLEIRFTPDGAHALVVRRPPFGSTSGVYAELLSLDAPEGAKARELEGVLDAWVDGSAVLLLRPSPAGAEVVNALTGAILQWITLETGPIASARFSGSPKTVFGMDAPLMTMMMPLMPKMAQGPPKMPPMVVLMDRQGGLHLAIREKKTALKIPLAEGTRPIALDPDSGHLALRHPETGDSVMQISGDKPIWTAQNGENSFQTFVAGGQFIGVEDAGGWRIESLSSEVALQPENARRTDWDLSAMVNLSDYNAIVSVAIARDEGLVVTGRKDGRIVVWRPSMEPRYGVWGAMPMPSFERVARLDHGDAFGTQRPFWTGPQNLFVSDDGRFVASQSLRLKTNPVGGVEQFDPVLRIWSVRHETEIARLRLPAPTIAVFAPNRPLMALAEANPGGEGVALSLWDLSTEEPKAAETREILKELVIAKGEEGEELDLEAAAENLTDNKRSTPSPENPMQMPEELFKSYNFLAEAQRVWVSVDLKLRAQVAERGPTVALDDLSGMKDAIVKDTNTRFPGGLEVDQLFAMADAGFDTTFPVIPAPLPISIAGEFAYLAVGGEIRVYVLDDQPRLLRTQPHEGSTVLRPAAVMGAADGRTAAVLLVKQNWAEAIQESKAGLIPAEIRVLRAGTSDPVYRGQTYFAPTRGMIMQTDRVLAFGPNGRQMLLERLIPPDPEAYKPPMVERVLVPFDGGRSERRLNMVPLSRVRLMQAMMPTPGGGSAVDALAGFDATGARAVLLHEEPNCPMKAGMTPSMLPIAVPSCPDRRITATIYATETGDRVRAGSFLLASDAEAAEMKNATSMMFMGIGSADMAHEVMLSDAGAQSVVTVTRESIETKAEIGELTLTLVRRIRELAFPSDDRLRDQACARLPGAAKALSAQSWARLVPIERYSQVCR